ncbi:RNA GG bind domain containing protein [Asbolus verrucosus]|uniref:Phosphorylated adapter RNA export protein n=1 Tax=Asbolus verrucosus TaxID=1661398 RepID=A0A482V8G0_ASBVE|nr:RNA GG bind domain containing protein [Asbolus verrucosus]
MEQDEVVLEEGELSDDSDTYTPLERPANYSASQPNARFPVVPESESETELQSSDSDSDSDCNKKKSKKPKIKLKPKLQQPKQKKYDIWSTRVQEEVLAETLNSCDVTIKDRSRSVETYDYLGSHFERKNNKRTRDDRYNPNIKSVGRSKSVEKVKGNARKIFDLAVNSTSSPEEIAKDIANKLYEEKEELILRVIDALGVDKTFLLFKETKRIEEEGGMLVMNQTRRRTPGGVFLFLVRHDYDITPEQKDKIFDDEKQKAKVMIRNKQKKKLKKLKEEIAASKAKLLPDLLTRAELLAKENNRVRKETDERDVINPPPTPETDGHENSGDGMEGVNGIDSLDSRRKFESYDDDFLDINCSNDMDLF